MGKIFSRFKFFGSAASKAQRTAYAERGFDDITKNNHSQSIMTSQTVSKLNEANNFNEFDNLLNVNCSPTSSVCIFGQADYSVQLFDFVRNKKIKAWKGHEKDVTKVGHFRLVHLENY